VVRFCRTSRSSGGSASTATGHSAWLTRRCQAVSDASRGLRTIESATAAAMRRATDVAAAFTLATQLRARAPGRPANSMARAPTARRRKAASSAGAPATPPAESVVATETVNVRTTLAGPPRSYSPNVSRGCGTHQYGATSTA
jgi:hypothetical protein